MKSSWGHTHIVIQSRQNVPPVTIDDIVTQKRETYGGPLQRAPEVQGKCKMRRCLIEFFSEPDFAARCRVIAREERFELRQDCLL